MGASGSITNYIYISYDLRLKTNEDIKHICSELEEDGIITIHSELACEHSSHLPLSEKLTNVESIVSRSRCLIIFISEDTLKSPFQMIEMNNIIFTTKNIIYIMMDEKYTPINTPYLQLLVRNNKWFSLNDKNLMENIIKNIKT
jgi:hypothetical protein